MTKVLIITNKSDITSDFIVKRLKEKKIDFYRFNTEEFTKSVKISLDFSLNTFLLIDSITNKKYDLKDFSSVYYRRPEIPSIKENELTSGEYNFFRNELFYMLEGVYKLLRNAYWISPIYSIREAENKIYQLDVAKSLGFEIPNSIVSNSFEKINNFYQENDDDCIIKPIKSGLIEDDLESKVVFTSILKSISKRKKSIELCPNYLQSHISKKSDIRVIMVGDCVFATLIDSQVNNSTLTDWRKGEQSLKHTKIELPNDIKTKCISLLKILKLRFGAVDFILDKNNNYIFLEINPNGQWAWIESQIGYDISNEIVKLLQNENF